MEPGAAPALSLRDGTGGPRERVRPVVVPAKVLPRSGVGEHVRTSSMEQKRKVIPPVYFFVALLLMAALHRFLPVAHLLSPPYSYLGAVLLLAGLVLGGHAFRGFSKAGTP